MNSHSLENLSLLSSINRYNTERRLLIRGYFDSILQSGAIFNEEVTQESIQEYWESDGLAPEQPENVFINSILISATRI